MVFKRAKEIAHCQHKDLYVKKHGAHEPIRWNERILMYCRVCGKAIVKVEKKISVIIRKISCWLF